VSAARLGVAIAIGSMLLPTTGAVAADNVGAFDPDTAEWHILRADNTIRTFTYGNPSDVPFMGDWDCDGTDTPGLYRQSDGFVYLRNSNTTGVADVRFFFGDPGDVPIAGDFDGDTCDTVSVYRPSTQEFFIIDALGSDDNGLGPATTDFVFGDPGDRPFAGDFDDDGIDTFGLHRGTTGFVYYRNSLTAGVADARFFYGDPGDQFVTGDWSGGGPDTVGVFR
jgi:hypothetical protein